MDVPKQCLKRDGKQSRSEQATTQKKKNLQGKQGSSKLQNLAAKTSIRRCENINLIKGLNRRPSNHLTNLTQMAMSECPRGTNRPGRGCHIGEGKQKSNLHRYIGTAWTTPKECSTTDVDTEQVGQCPYSD